jgi:hypothetical protein
MSDLLHEATIAIQSGDTSLAKQLLSQALVQDPINEYAWLLMSDVVSDVRLRRNCLERVLAINPENRVANSALAKLDTSPLSPVTRGERDKPIYPLKYDRVPPFTPPSTWGNDQEQYISLGDLTYPSSPTDPPNLASETTPTFDWANDSAEPDKTINQLFTAVSDPDSVSQSFQDTEFSWLDENPPDLPVTATLQNNINNDPIGIGELVETEVEPLPDQDSSSIDDFTVSSDPELGLEAFISIEKPNESDGQELNLWDNPNAKKDRMVILSTTSLIYANPKESDIPHLKGLFAEKKMLRDLLGEKAGVIKLESIQRLLANPIQSDLTIEYQNQIKKRRRHKLVFSSPPVRDEVLTAIRLRPGSYMHESVQIFKLEDKIVPPLAALIFLIFLVWVLFAGLPLLGSLNGSDLGILQAIISSLQDFVSSVGRDKLLLLIILGGLLDMVWLVSNLKKPTKLIIFE